MYTNHMQVNVLFFGAARELAGVAQERLDLAEGGHLDDLWRQCQMRYPRLGEIAGSLVTAVNQEIAQDTRALRDGDEVAFLPPVSGGAGNEQPDISNSQSEISNFKFEISDNSKPEISNPFYCRLTRAPIPTHDLTQELKAPADGAVVVFEGIVRNHSHGKRTLYLEYEAYEPMALRKMEEIAGETKQKFAVDRVGMIHRLGRLEIGATSVAIIVTSAHRRAAFEACHYAIDRLKEVVPIWKKEHFEDGAVWAEGENLKAE